MHSACQIVISKPVTTFMIWKLPFQSTRQRNYPLLKQPTGGISIGCIAEESWVNHNILWYSTLSCFPRSTWLTSCHKLLHQLILCRRTKYPPSTRAHRNLFSYRYFKLLFYPATNATSIAKCFLFKICLAIR